MVQSVIGLFKTQIPVEAYAASLWDSGKATDEVSATVEVGTGDNIDERLSQLKALIDQLRTETDTKIKELRQALGDLKKSVAQETRERQAADEMTARKIEELAVGGLHLEMVGLTWLIVGLIETSIPDEIVWLVSLIRDSTRLLFL